MTSRRAARGRSAREQPTAPVPRRARRLRLPRPGPLPRAGPQGRRRAPIPGLRHAIGDHALALDIPQDIEGIDVGPAPTPYERAEAARRRGLRRRAHVVPHERRDAGQPRAVPRARAARARASSSQRNSHASLVDGLVLSGGMPAFVAPEYDDGLGDGARRDAGGAAAALERGAGRRARGVHRLADLLRHGRRRRRAARRSRTPPACRSSSTRRGARTSASTRPAAERAGATAPTPC